MTDEEREQVVELLRCAADDRPLRLADGLPVLNGMFGAGDDDPGECDLRIWKLAWGARDSIDESLRHGSIERYRECLLEAAMRVEEGSWP